MSFVKQSSSRPHLLLIYAGHAGGRTHEMVAAVKRGVADAGEDLELRALPALQAGVDDLLWANGLLIGTPEHFGYMAGAIKDFFDRTFYPAQGRVEGLPYAMFVSAGNDGTGAVAAIERIALGYRWKQCAEPLIVKGELSAADLQRCAELGQTFAAGLALGVL
ncbi:flavodoxin family protein [Steroidobacter sp. S1-65]|uniref:Flavodoxin family protein n=1 Tax=Steroidobacter gossypii TaxID=2805490 RepID=A0ABS1WSQ7_9GAMM|nr:NAD(P)H-dependent oxidoreductase [Steroidobacter gossypii]MBM0103982.1 flavodoxin family protein [Steroidobacter gossypii]